MKTILFFMTLLMLLAQVSGAAETNLTLRTFIKDVLLREDDPNKNTEIIEYAQRSGIDTQQVTRVLEAILNETLSGEESESERYVLSKMSIDALGKLGNMDSLPLLAKASKANDKNRRIGAISAYVRVAREDSLVFAKEIVANPDQFGMMERCILYERLAVYAQKTDDPILDAKREAIRQFLMDTMQTEPSPEAAKMLDELLCGISPDYKVSLQRASAAQRFQYETTPVFRDYFNGVLNELRKVLILEARVTLKPEALEVNPGILTAFVRLPEGYPVSGITTATCDGARSERMMLNEDGTEMIIKFRRRDIETALAQIGESLDIHFVVRGTWQDAAGTWLFQGADSITKIVGIKSK